MVATIPSLSNYFVSVNFLLVTSLLMSLYKWCIYTTGSEPLIFIKNYKINLLNIIVLGKVKVIYCYRQHSTHLMGCICGDLHILYKFDICLFSVYCYLSSYVGVVFSTTLLIIFEKGSVVTFQSTFLILFSLFVKQEHMQQSGVQKEYWTR